MKVRIIAVCILCLLFFGGCGDEPQIYWTHATEQEDVEVGTDSDETVDTGSAEDDETYEGYLDSETLWESVTGWETASDTQYDSETETASDTQYDSETETASDTQYDSETGSLSDGGTDSESEEEPKKDECDNTAECQEIYGSAATDCVNSKSDNSFCKCGVVPCRVNAGAP